MKEFEDLIIDYEETGRTFTMTVEEMIKFILGTDNEPEEVRLLLEEDGSLSILKWNKDIKIVSTNILGFKVMAFGYVKINLNIYQDPEDELKKNPIFTIEVGTILKLGSTEHVIPIIDEEKNLPPLTLKYTLDQIEGVYELFKGDFIKDIKNLAQLILNGDFDKNLVPILLNTTSLIKDLTNAVKKEEEDRNPNSTLEVIFNLVENIENIIETKGLALLNGKNQLAQNISSGLLNFVSSNFGEALEMFQKVKSKLEEIKKLSEAFLDETSKNYTDIDLSKIGDEVVNLLSPDIKEKYDEEIEKAKEILNFIDYVKDEGLNYTDLINKIGSNHDSDFLDFVKDALDLFFQNQTSIVDVFRLNVTNRLAVVKAHVDSLKN